MENDGRLIGLSSCGSSQQAVSPVPASIPDASRLTKDERSFILYAETCCVDAGGLLVGARMNAEDHAAALKFVENGFMFFGRIPSELLGEGPSGVTHWCELTLAGYELAWQCRRARASRRGPHSTAVFSHDLTLRKLAAQGMSAEGQDPQGLGATPASPVGNADAPKE